MSFILNNSDNMQKNLKNALTLRLNNQFKEKLEKNNQKLADLSKELSSSSGASGGGGGGAGALKELEDYIDKIKDLFDETFIESNLEIRGNMFVDTIECSEIIVTSANNLNITRLIESVFGDSANENPNLDIIDMIRGKNLKLSSQTISDSELLNCKIVGGTIEGIDISHLIPRSCRGSCRRSRC